MTANPTADATATTAGAATGTAAYPAYPLLTPEDVPGHLRSRGLLHLLGVAGPGELTVREVSDGNLNRIFLVRRAADPDAPGLAVKQALPYVRVHGESWPFTPFRAAAEARAYRYLSRITPEFVPAFHDYDPDTFTLVLEDVGHLRVLRGATIDGAPPGDVGRRIGAFVARLELRHLRLRHAVGRAQAAHRRGGQPGAVRAHRGDDPRRAVPGARAQPQPSRRSTRCAERLRADARAAPRDRRLRHTFMTKAEALLHGDLHTGSIMVAGPEPDARIAVIDPEFAFVGPIGFDLGLFWANALIAAVRADVLGDRDRAAEHAAQVAASWEAFTGEFRRLWPSRVDTVFDDGFLEVFLAGVWRDGLGFAGGEAMRRVIGYAHVADIDGLPDPEQGRAAERVALLARELIVRRGGLGAPDEVAALALGAAA